MTADGGCLCIGCLERRLGRQLCPKDFPQGRPFNSAEVPGTERLQSRRWGLGRTPRLPRQIAWRRAASSAPDVSDPLVGHRGVNNGVRDRAMAHESLQRPRIDSPGRQHIAGSMARHVSMNREWKLPRPGQAVQSASVRRRWTAVPCVRIGRRSLREGARAGVHEAAASRHPASHEFPEYRSWLG